MPYRCRIYDWFVVVLGLIAIVIVQLAILDYFGGLHAIFDGLRLGSILLLLIVLLFGGWVVSSVRKSYGGSSRCKVLSSTHWR